MSHPFGDRLSQHLHRKHGLSQAKLAAGILQAPAIITDMCKGRRLTGPQARERVVAIIQWLHEQAALTTIEEANALLTAADLFPLQSSVPAEAALLQQLPKATVTPPTMPPAAMLASDRLAPRHNLPVQSTTFIGRETEQAQIATLLADPNCRLLTLVGPGGVGKTRLALQAVATQLSDYEHGVWLVALAPLLTADLVAATCLEALNLGQQPHMTPDEQWLHYLRHKHLLLLLDNFEHLPVAVGLVKAILNTAPQVKVLVTSRERLKVQEEWVFTVGGLATPSVTNPMDETQLAAVAESSASRLFIERARRLQPTFALTTGNAAAVAQICRLVDGIPLAIELAAGWSRLLPPAAIAQAMAQDFGFLSSAWQDLPPRHQSLTAVFTHSWQLLTAPEQAALRQLVVFRGGFRAEAAQAVAGASLALLGELVDKSWLRVSDSGRFDLHELIRQFIGWQRRVNTNGADQTEMQQPEAALFDRHSRYYGAFLQSQEPFLYGPRQREVLDELLTEVDNIRQGWRWAIEHVEVENISKYLKSWQWLGEVRSWHRDMAQAFSEATKYLKVLLAIKEHQANDISTQVTLARALYYQARHVEQMASTEQAETLCRESLTYWPEQETTDIYRSDRTHVSLVLAASLYAQGRYAESESLCCHVLHVCQDNRDQVGLQSVYDILGHNAYTQGRCPEARQWFEQSLSIAIRSGEKVRKKSALAMLAEIFANQGDYQYAEQLTWEVHEIGETFGFRQAISRSYALLGYIALLTGHWEKAEQYFQLPLRFAEEINANFARLNSRRWLGNIAYRQNDFPTARQWFCQALKIARSIHRRTDEAIVLTGLGKVDCAQEDLSSARTRFHQALDLLQKTRALPDLLDVLVGMSQWWLQAGAPETAARLVGFVRQHPSLLPLARQGAAQVYTQLQAMLPEEGLVAALAAGATMTVDEAVALAL